MRGTSLPGSHMSLRALPFCSEVKVVGGVVGTRPLQAVSFLGGHLGSWERSPLCLSEACTPPVALSCLCECTAVQAGRCPE